MKTMYLWYQLSVVLSALSCVRLVLANATQVLMRNRTSDDRWEDIRCYYCESRVSFKECDESMKLVQCDGKFGFDRCIKTYIKASKYTQETYQRGCLSASACEAPSCKARGNDTCEVYCCEEDYCNKSTTRMVSGTMLFIFSLLNVLIGQMS